MDRAGWKNWWWHDTGRQKRHDGWLCCHAHYAKCCTTVVMVLPSICYSKCFSIMLFPCCLLRLVHRIISSSHWRNTKEWEWKGEKTSSLLSNIQQQRMSKSLTFYLIEFSSSVMLCSHHVFRHLSVLCSFVHNVCIDIREKRNMEWILFLRNVIRPSNFFFFAKRHETSSWVNRLPFLSWLSCLKSTLWKKSCLLFCWNSWNTEKCLHHHLSSIMFAYWVCSLDLIPSAILCNASLVIQSSYSSSCWLEKREDLSICNRQWTSPGENSIKYTEREGGSKDEKLLTLKLNSKFSPPQMSNPES